MNSSQKWEAIAKCWLMFTIHYRERDHFGTGQKIILKKVECRWYERKGRIMGRKFQWEEWWDTLSQEDIRTRITSSKYA